MTVPADVRVCERSADGTSHRRAMTAVLGAGPFLVVAPHDDDMVLGAGITVAAAVRHGIEVHLAVATDGALGYVELDAREGLLETRRGELVRACAELGLRPEHVHRLDYPDGSLVGHQGCRGEGRPDTLSQRLVTLLRACRPSTVFVCTPADVHPDHRVAASETEIACVWASSRIWLERGEPIAAPRRFYYAVYAPFEGDPDVQLAASPEVFEQKLEALRCFASQGVIEPMVARLSAAGPYEYLRRARLLEYQPDAYRALF